MKKHSVALFLLVLFAALTVISCQSAKAMARDEAVTVVALTDATRTAIELKREGNTPTYLEEEYFPYLLANLSGRAPQTFPDVETKEELGHLTIGGCDVYTLGAEDSPVIILYVHGGAYTYGIDPVHVRLCDALSSGLGAYVCMPLYPLSPEAQYPEAYSLLDKLYEELLTKGKPICIMGDSAGGGLSLAYVEYRKGKGQKLPEKMVLVSPWLDISMSNPDIAVYEGLDLSLKSYGLVELGKLWAGQLDTRDPLVSPIYGNLENLPPTLLVTGTDEVMYPDIVKLFHLIENAGGQVSLLIGEGQGHVYVAGETPEALDSVSLIEDFLRR